jgi:RimJ/RimL family protein N-acetyltransferase
MLFFQMNITLIPITPEDFPMLISWAVSKEFLLQWTGRTFKYPLTEKQLIKYYKGMARNNPVRIIYKAVTENKHIGCITVDWEKSFKNEASITCVIVGDKDFQGKGAGELIVNKACTIAFDEFSKVKLALNVFSFNHSAIRCYEKCGFTEKFRTKIEFGGNEYINIRMEKIK